MERLEQADIKVVIVELPTNLTLQGVGRRCAGADERTLGRRRLANWRTHSNVAVVTYAANADPAATADAICRRSKDHRSGVHREQSAARWIRASRTTSRRFPRRFVH